MLSNEIGQRSCTDWLALDDRSRRHCIEVETSGDDTVFRNLGRNRITLKLFTQRDRPANTPEASAAPSLMRSRPKGRLLIKLHSHQALVASGAIPLAFSYSRWW